MTIYTGTFSFQGQFSDLFGDVEVVSGTLAETFSGSASSVSVSGTDTLAGNVTVVSTGPLLHGTTVSPVNIAAPVTGDFNSILSTLLAQAGITGFSYTGSLNVTATTITFAVTASGSAQGFTGGGTGTGMLVAQASSGSATTITVGAGQGLPASFDATASMVIDLSQATTKLTLSGLTGNDTITVGPAGANISATSGNDQLLIPASATGSTSFTNSAGNHSVTAAGGTNTLVSGSNSDIFSLTGGTNTATTGSGQTTFVVTGGSNTVIANQGTATVTDSSASLLLGLLGGSGQVSLNGGVPVILATGGANTITATAASPLIGLFGGTDKLTLGSGGAQAVFGLGATATIQAGAGTAAIGQFSGQLQITPGAGEVDLFLFGGSGTLLEHSGAGIVVVSGFSAQRLAIDIPRTINGNNFTSAAQIPITHDASGNTLINLGAPGNAGAQLILLAGTSSISASAITLT